MMSMNLLFFFFSSRRRHTRCGRDWSSDVCSSDLIVIDYRSVDGRSDRFPELAADLVRAKPDIIVTRGMTAALAAKAAAGSIPIVMATASDPVGAGIVPNLARPGGNLTGMTTLSSELDAKRLE